MGTDNSWRNLLLAIRDEEWEEAILSIDNLIKKEPFDPDHFVSLADMQLKGGNAKEAAEAYRKAIRLYKDAHDTGRAIVACNRLLELEPENAEIIGELDLLLTDHKKHVSALTPAQHGRAGPGPVHLTDKLRAFVESGDAHELLKLLLKNASFNSMAEHDSVTFSDGEQVIREGEQGDSIFVIISGGVEVSVQVKGRKVPLAILIDGDIFGEMGFLTSRPRTATVTAVTDLELIELKKPALEHIIEKNPHLLRYLYDVYISRMGVTLSELKTTTDRGISGSLRELGLADIMQVLEQTGKKGVLFIEAEGISGSVYFSQGMVEDAVSEHLRGEDLIVEFLQLRDGTFRYEPREIKKGPLSKPVGYIVMECVRLMDEKALLREYLPDDDSLITLGSPKGHGDNDMKSVSGALAEGPKTVREIKRATGLSRTRVVLSVAKLIREGVAVSEKKAGT